MKLVSDWLFLKTRLNNLPFISDNSNNMNDSNGVTMEKDPLTLPTVEVGEDTMEIDNNKKRKIGETGASSETNKEETVEEMRQQLAMYKKSYETSQAQLEEKIRELDEAQDHIKGAADDMEKLVDENEALGKAKEAASSKIIEVEKEKRALELNIAELQQNVVADPNAEQRKENLARLERIRNRFEKEGNGEYKTLTPCINRKNADPAEGGKGEDKKCASPSCADPKPHGSVPIEVCESKLRLEPTVIYKNLMDFKSRKEALEAQRSEQGLAPTKAQHKEQLLKLEVCTRDPCRMGPEKCAFLHPSEGKSTTHTYNFKSKTIITDPLRRGSQTSNCQQGRNGNPEIGQEGWIHNERSQGEGQRQRRPSPLPGSPLSEPLERGCSVRKNVQSCLRGQWKPELSSSLTTTESRTKDCKDPKAEAIVNDSVRNKLYNSHETDHFSSTGSLPSLVVSNSNKFRYLGNKPLVLRKDKYEAVDWDTLDNLVEGKKESSNVELKGEKERLGYKSIQDDNKDSQCPFGVSCPQIHNPCQVFKPTQSRKHNPKTEKFNIYSCNVRSINNKKDSMAAILNNNDIDICILSELSTQNMPKFKGYTNFECLKKRRNHGICMMVKNHLREGVIRIAEEELEIVHIRFENTTPPLNVIGVYLDVEANSTVADIKNAWFKYKNRVDSILDKGEALVTLGDFNRPIDNPKITCGKNLLTDWVKEGTMTLLNSNEPTRVDPGSKKESILDLAFVSKNIESYVKSFYVDSEKNMTPYNKIGNFSDHKAIKVVLEVPVVPAKAKNKKEERINFRNVEGWNIYAEVSDKFAEEMVIVIQSNEDLDVIENKIQAIDLKIQKESFGTIWIGPPKKKKAKKRSTAQVKKEVTQSFDELDNMINKGLLKKDLNQQMYKLKEAIVGPKIKPQEPMAINHPRSKELITNKTEIKKAYLDHNVGILTKKPIADEFKNEVKIKEDCHEKIMARPVEKLWELEQPLFKKVVDKIKKKGKQVYKLFVKSGIKYKEAVFKYMAKLIETEQIPLCFKNTVLTPIWKRKGSALDLNNMRFIHMRHWRSKLLESLVTEFMKDKIVNATPKFQLGGIPKCRSVENLVVLKTWMKMKEERNQSGIFQCFDMEKFFDKERLLDCMYTLHTKAKVDDKSYRLWFRLNEDTRISVNTSVGRSRSKVIEDSVGQGSAGAAIVSSLNIGCAVEDAFKDQTSTTIGDVELNSEVFQDDIANLNDDTGKQRQACKNIYTELTKKGLSINYNKSKFVVIGNKKQRREILKETSENPIKMGDSCILNSEQEQYLGDIINQEGCAASITETIKERMRKLTSKCHDIIQICESPIMGGLGNSTAPFKLFNATVAEGLLTNCESWIGINQNQINMLQSFQDKFIKNTLRLADSIPKAILTWDIGLTPVKWRIAQKKLLFLHRIMMKDIRNITKQILYEEVIRGIKGLAYECSLLCEEIGIQNIMFFETTEAAIKDAVRRKMNEEALTEMTSKSKVSDRISDNPRDNSYILELSLPESRVWIRYRGRAISGVKCNFKNSHKNNLECRFCPRSQHKSDLNESQEFSDQNQRDPDEMEELFSVFQGNTPGKDEEALSVKKYPDETQEHLEVCEGTQNERRGIQDMSNWRNVLKFWRRMSTRLSRMSTKTTRTSKSKT